MWSSRGVGARLRGCLSGGVQLELLELLLSCCQLFLHGQILAFQVTILARKFLPKRKKIMTH